MREMKFRAWFKTIKKMVYEWDIVWQTDILNPFDGIDTNDTVIMQYTGSKDKNGKRIFEGDISIPHGVVEFVIAYGYELCGFYFKDLHKGEYHPIDYLTVPIKVIGNVYENPELLGGE
jgi:uncharacterized phage protein (TIGR01671 family)